jgi:excisionase family DNA binding protein
MLSLSSTQIRVLREILAEILHNELRRILPQYLASPAVSQSAPVIEKDPLLSRAQAARILGVSIQTISKLIRLRHLPSIKVQRRTLIRQSDLAIILAVGAGRAGSGS